MELLKQLYRLIASKYPYTCDYCENKMLIFRIVYTLFCLISLSIAEITRMDAVKTDFDNVAFSGYMLMQKNVSSAIECTLLCERESQCKSFVHDIGSGVCSLHDTSFVNIGNTYSVPGARYYKAGQKDICPIHEGFVHFREVSACHLLSENRHMYADADAYCISLGGHLSKFDTETERQAVIKLKYSSVSGSGYNIGAYFTGAYQDGPGNTWVWRDGTSALVPSYWRPGEPSGEGQCAYMCANNPQCEYNDYPCGTKKHRVMCEIDI